MTTKTTIESAIAASLAYDRHEAAEHCERVADSLAEETCQMIVRQIISVLNTPGIQWVVFGEEPGRVVLVVCSGRRRADFRINRGGTLIRVVRVDDNMKIMVDRLNSEQHDQLQHIAEWVGGSKMP